MKKLMALLFTVIVFINCSEKKEKPKYKIEIETKNLIERKIKVEVRTNFPDKTPFVISVSRNYKRKQNSENYAGELYSSYNSIVKNGFIEFTFDANDSKWVEEYKNLQKKYGEAEKSLTDIDFNRVKDTIEIYILYTPKGEQSKEIKNLIGVNGENLRGDGTEDNGDFKTFSKTIKIYNEYK